MLPWADELAIAGTVAATIGLAAYSTRSARTTGDFYVAGRSVPPWWNASAISGEYLSAASFLGVAGLIMVGGADALWFPVGYAVGYVLLLALVAAPLRRSGAYTLPDFAEARLHSASVRLAASILVVGIGWLYVVPQLQGAGLALRVLLGTPMWVGAVVVAVTVIAVLVSGGMRSVTLVQGFQYWLKVVAIALPVLFLVAVWRADGQPSAAPPTPPVFPDTTTVRIADPVTVTVTTAVTVTATGVVNDQPVAGPMTWEPAAYTLTAGTTVTFPGGTPVPHTESVNASTGTDWATPFQSPGEHPGYRTYALMIALFFGTMGLPHVLVRFYTNPDGAAARRTALGVIGLVGLFYLWPVIYGSLGRIYTPELLLTGQTDAVVLLLPRTVIPGTAGELIGALVAAGAAAAFLATATGLTVSVAGVLSQDIVSRRVRNPVAAFRVAALAAVLVPLGLGLLASSLPLARAVTLAFAVAAATFCPLLLLGIWWSRLTDVGALAGLITGGTLAGGAIVLSSGSGLLFGEPLTGWPAALTAQPAAWAMPAALLTMVVVSLATRRRLQSDVNRILVRLHTPETVAVRRTWIARSRS